MTYFHGYTSLLCCETPVPRGRPFRPRQRPLSCPLQAGIRFLGRPVPSTPFVGLTASIPLPRGVYRFPSSVSEILMVAVGAAFRPGTSLSVCHPVSKAVMARFLCRFWLKCSITLVSLVADYDPFSDSAFASPWHHLPGGWSGSGSALLHVFPRASHPSVPRGACHGRYIPN